MQHLRRCVIHEEPFLPRLLCLCLMNSSTVRICRRLSYSILLTPTVQNKATLTLISILTRQLNIPIPRPIIFSLQSLKSPSHSYKSVCHLDRNFFWPKQFPWQPLTGRYCHETGGMLFRRFGLKDSTSSPNINRSRFIAYWLHFWRKDYSEPHVSPGVRST
jgi:hypothetical protein